MEFHSHPWTAWLFIVPLILVVGVGLVSFFRTRGPRFKLASPLLSVPEQELYRRLVAALPDHVILAQVAFSQMIDVVGGSPDENFRKRLTAMQKVADYVVCDTNFRVVAVVELDDSSHHSEKDQRRDEMVLEAGARTIRWRVSKMPSRDEIRAAILNV
jgi:hypothetical protein